MSGAKEVVLDAVSKQFGRVEAVRELSLRIRSGEFLTLLGPSGCGKSTILRMIAGLEQVSGGRILVGEEDVTGLPPNRRDTSIMFQDYALFPHKTLLDNVAYGLKMRGVGRGERANSASAWLDRIGLPGFEDRMPHQLSGGQRQRVALARSLIVSPAVLLLDEPLGALDADLRKRMQRELRRIHQDVGLTFVYVTHDQEEALAMSDRIAVMQGGRIEQLGTPKEIYDTPASGFVARFIGACNVIAARVACADSSGVKCSADGFPPLQATLPEGAAAPAAGDAVALALRPERIAIRPPGEDDETDVNRAVLTVAETSFAGSNVKIRADSPDGESVEIDVARKSETGQWVPSPGEMVLASWKASDLAVLGRDEDQIA